jgi:hypothetical protein
MKFKVRILSVFLFLVFIAKAQVEKTVVSPADTLKLKHLSLGVKLGMPNLASLSSEVVLPFFENHIAPFISYGKIPLNFDEINTRLSYSELGAKYYFNSKGNGFYLGVGKGSLSTDITFSNLQFSNANESFIGEGETNFTLKTTNFSIGVKTSGTFFFSFELGYGIGSVPTELEFSAVANGIQNTFTESIPPIPGLGGSGILIGTAGFGISL